MDKNLIARAKTFEFIALWFHWCEIYMSDLSVKTNRKYGYRAGVFFQGGAKKGEHHGSWPSFFDSMASMSVPYTSIHAIFGYQNYYSCRVFIDSQGTNYIAP